jgi:hypothetical protein
LKFSIIIAKHKKRQELAVVKRAMCDEQIEFERQNTIYFFWVLHVIYEMACGIERVNETIINAFKSAIFNRKSVDYLFVCLRE